MTTREREVVGALERAIVRRIGEPRYGLWFHGHTRFAWEADLLTVGVPNLHLQEWLQKKFEPAVREAAAEAFGQPMRVRFAIDPELFRAARKEQAEAKGPAAEGATERSVPSAQYSVPGGEDARPGGNHSRKKDSSPGKSDSLAGQQDGLPGRPSTEPRPSAGGPRPSAPEPRKHKRRWRRLGEFVVGPCNRVAHASALSAVEAPGQGPNPLVLHGPVGTGKTHLLEGVYAGLRKARPDWRVCFVTAEDFTTRFVQAVRLGKLGAFRRHFRECDALLVDDLHFLAAKKATQEEFLHTFDALLSDGRQLVVTCDCHPKLSDDFLPELADRLLGGAVWGLAPPDAETRLALLRSKAVRLGEPAVPEEVLQHLAGQLRGNVRELEGALHSLRHFSRVAGRPIDMGLAREALADLLRHAVRVVRLEDVEAAVCRVLRLEAGAMRSRERAWAVSHPRMVAMFLARKHTAAAYSEVGQHFGGRNHSTVVAAEKKVRQWQREDGELVLGERRLRVREVIELAERELLR